MQESLGSVPANETKPDVLQVSGREKSLQESRKNSSQSRSEPLDENYSGRLAYLQTQVIYSNLTQISVTLSDGRTICVVENPQNQSHFTLSIFDPITNLATEMGITRTNDSKYFVSSAIESRASLIPSPGGHRNADILVMAYPGDPLTDLNKARGRLIGALKQLFEIPDAFWQDTLRESIRT